MQWKIEIMIKKNSIWKLSEVTQAEEEYDPLATEQHTNL